MCKTLIAVALAFGIVLTLASSSVTAALPDSSGSILLLLSESSMPSTVPPEARLAPILKSLQANHHLTQYEWLADANAFRVEGADAAAAQIFLTLPGVARVTPARAEILDAARQQQQREKFTAQRRLSSETSKAERIADTPYFDIHETWDMIQAKGLAAGQAVTAVLKDSGSNVKDTLNVNADGNGNLQAWFNADVAQGDSVAITYNATNVTIFSDAITINFDFNNDHISGTAGNDRKLYVNVNDDGIGWCERHESFMETMSNGAGAYDADLSASYDVIRRTEVNVSSIDENDNGWTVWRHAPWLMLRTLPNSNNGNGNGLAPDEDVDIVLKTGATEKFSQTFHTNYPDSSFGFGIWGADMLPGDTLTATENGNTWANISIVQLTTNLNAAKGKVTGKAPANQPVVVRSDDYNSTTGDWNVTCQTVTADGSGDYSANVSKNLGGYDSVTTFYVDANGFEQQVWDVVSYLYAQKGASFLEGTFKTSFDGAMDIAIYNKQGALKYQAVGYAFGGWFSQRLAKNGKPVKLAAQDTIAVTPQAGNLGAQAATPLTGTVAKVNMTLDVATNSVTGTAPPNSYLFVTGQKWWGNGYECRDDCWIKVASGANGAFQHTFNNDLVAGDFAEVVLIDAKGNLTYQQASSTLPTITLNSFPPTFRRGRPNEVKYTIANGLHVDDTGVLWDSSSRPDWNYTIQNGVEGNWWPGGPGQYSVNVWTAHQGKIYFRAMARVDGRWIYTMPESVAKAR